jgi:hypothetical protein
MATNSLELAPNYEDFRVYSNESYESSIHNMPKNVHDISGLTPVELFDQKNELFFGDRSALIAVGYEDIVKRAIESRLIEDKVTQEIISAHQVGIGMLYGYKRKAGPNGIPVTDTSKRGNIMSVAMKPFRDMDKAANEYMGYQILRSIGIETFDPVGIFPSNDGETSVVITKYRSDLKGLDQDTWLVGRRVTSQEDIKTHELNTKTVKEIAEVLAILHSNGVFHPDGQIKNYAITENGQVGVIDTENLTVVDDDFELASAHAWRDIQKLMRSLIKSTKEDGTYGVGMLAGMSNETLRNCFEELFLDPYTNKLAELSNEKNAQRIEELYDGLIENYHHDVDSWPSSLVGPEEQSQIV